MEQDDDLSAINGFMTHKNRVDKSAVFFNLIIRFKLVGIPILVAALLFGWEHIIVWGSEGYIVYGKTRLRKGIFPT